MNNDVLKYTAAFWVGLGGVLGSAPMAFAETTLTAIDGSVTLQGKLISTDEQNYVLETDMGQLIVRREFVSCSGDDCPVDTAAVDDKSAALVSLDGSVRLEGMITDVTASDYVIETATGTFTVQREFVRCEGAGCPTTTVTSTEFSVSVPGLIGRDVFSTVLEDFVASKGFSITPDFGSDGATASFLIGNESGIEVAKISAKSEDDRAALTDLIAGSTAVAYTRGRVSPELLSDLVGRRIDDVSEIVNEDAIGLDAVVFVVNPANRIDIANMDILRSVLSGQLANWSQLGGIDAPISIHMLAEDDGARALLDSQMLQGANLRASVITHDSAAALNAALQDTPAALAIGYRSQFENGKVLALSSSCKIYFETDEFSLQTEEYPLVERWYQYSLKGGEIDEFASNIEEFITTDAGQQAIASTGLVTQELRLVPMKDQGARLMSTVLGSGDDKTVATVATSYIDTVATAQRISTSLRFLTGSTRLDVKSIGDIKRISEIVRSPDFEGYEFIVFGFSDSYGALQTNLNLSLARAAVVKSVLLQENKGFLEDAQVQTVGVGPIAPVGCNATARGRELNRRVEIWVRPQSN